MTNIYNEMSDPRQNRITRESLKDFISENNNSNEVKSAKNILSRFDEADRNNSGRINPSEYKKKFSPYESDNQIQNYSENSSPGPSSTNRGSANESKPNSEGKVLLTYAWSDTQPKYIEEKLRSLGITDFKSGGSRDKGLGAAVVTKEQALEFEKWADRSSKIFSTTQSIDHNIKSTSDLTIEFSPESKGETKSFGNHRSISSSIVTDDPSHTSRPASGGQKGDDALWTVGKGETGNMIMNSDTGGGRQWVTMHIY